MRGLCVSRPGGTHGAEACPETAPGQEGKTVKGEIEVEHPDAVQITLTLTMALGDWKRIREQIQSAYPGWLLGNLIRDAVRKIEERVAIPETKEL